MGFFWRADHQQIYRELSKLKARGLVTGEEVAQAGRPNKFVYALTPKGTAALRTWSEKPSTSPSIKDDLLVRQGGKMPQATVAPSPDSSCV